MADQDLVAIPGRGATTVPVAGPALVAETVARRLAPLGRLPRDGVEVDVSWWGPARYPDGRAGSEAAVQAACGLMEVNGRDAGVPRRVGLEVASVAAGILAAQGVLAAGVAAARGRPVAVVRTSVLQAGLLLLSHYFTVATGLGDAVPGPPLPAPGPPFRSGDGHLFEIETLDPEGWKDLWTRLGAGDADLGRAWTVFRWRYERAACSLPPGLHEAAGRHSLGQVEEACRASGVSMAVVRGHADRPAPADQAGRAHPTVRPLAGPTPFLPRNVAPQCEIPRQEGGPLAGLRVVEATSRIQGPFAGMLLRMLGADVVRVQPPEGDYGRAAHTLHRGKETVPLDLGTAAGRSKLGQLVRQADVFLHNWRPGRAGEWELGPDELGRDHPGLVYAAFSGWGEEPENLGGGRRLGTDFLVQAEVGLADALTPLDEPAAPSRIILSDLFGALVGAEAILAGLYRRARQGGSWAVGSSLLAGAMALQAHVLERPDAPGRRRGRPAWGPLDQPVPTVDGWLSASVDRDDDLQRLGSVLGLGPGGTEAAVADRLAAGTAAEGEAVLLGAGLPGGVVAEDLAGVAADDRLAHLFEPAEAGVVPRAPWSFS